MFPLEHFKNGTFEVLTREDKVFGPTSICPFLAHDYNKIACAIEGWLLHLDFNLYLDYNLITHKTLDGRSFPCKCAGWSNNREYQTCPSYIEAVEQYKTKRAEFLALYAVQTAKVDKKFDAGKWKPEPINQH